MRTAIGIAALFSLAACGSGKERVPLVQQDQPETGAAAEVAALNVDQRNGVLEKAIRASGVNCNQVEKSERTEVRPGVKGWKAQCADGSAHLIQITPDGTANVTSRTH